MIASDSIDGPCRTVTSEEGAWQVSIKRTRYPSGNTFLVTSSFGGLLESELREPGMHCLAEALEAFGFCK